MSRFRTRNLVIGLALGSALAWVPIGGAVARADEAALEQFLAETATTPAQHQALAKYYRAKAAESKAEANNHRSMVKSSAGLSMPLARQQSEHCNKLASLSDAQAVEYEQLAASHEAQAKQAK